MSFRQPQKAAALIGLLMTLTASPAAASTAQPAQPPPAGEGTATSTAQSPAVQPSQQAPEKQLILIKRGEPSEPRPSVRPGDEFGIRVGIFIQNRGQQPEEYVLTVSLPPEQTLVSLDGLSARCDGTVCRGTVDPGPDATINLALRTRLSSSFRGTTTTIRSELQPDANPDADARTVIDTFDVQQPTSGGAAPAPSTQTGGTGTGAGGLQTLPRTGDRATITALLALCLLLLGAMAQLVGTRRPATHGG